MFNIYNVTIQLTEPLLGTIPKREGVYTEYIATKAPEPPADETPPVDLDEEGKGWTGFYLGPDGEPLLKDYQIKGFLKEAGNTLKTQVGIKALRSKIDNQLFVFPRSIPLGPVAGALERPLRAMTMQGPRVTVVRSDYVDVDTQFGVEIHVLDGSEIKEATLATLLDYGAYYGLGQWRNGGYGRFVYTLEAAG
jgi:hypothetical protein